MGTTFPLTAKGVDIPTTIRAEWRKNKGDYLITCPNGHGTDRVSEQRLKQAGQTHLRSTFDIVVDGWLLKDLMDSALEEFYEKGYSDYRKKVTIVRKKFPFALYRKTNLRLSCGCSVSVSFGDLDARVRVLTKGKLEGGKREKVHVI